METKKLRLGTRILKRVLLIAVAGCVLVFSGCGGITALLLQSRLERGGYLVSWDADEGRVMSGLSYGEGNARRYDLYLHDSIDPKVETPLLLFIHGGSWTEGSRNDMAYACKYYGKHGCITATMDYSLVSEDHPEITVETMLNDITACTVALKKQLEAEGYRVSGMAVGGTSAGGHLSLLYAYSRPADSAIPIAFVFEKVGPVSFRREFWGNRISAALIGYGARIPVDPAQLDKPEVIAAADSLSPLHFIGSGTVPTVFAYGGKDTLVRTIHRDELAKALEEHHVPNIRIDFPNSDHIMWNDQDCMERFREAVLQYCGQYLKLSPKDEK